MDYEKLIDGINSGLSSRDTNKIEENAKIIYENLNEDFAVLFKEYYNRVYDPDKGNGKITSYKEESLIREIIQNILDCNYSSEININIRFDDNEDSIEFEYNEDGFKMQDIVSFFSMNHTSKDSNNTGAFGIGAKGAMILVKRVEISSVYTDEHNDIETTKEKDSTRDKMPMHFETIIEKTKISKKETIQIRTILFDKNVESKDKSKTIFKIFVNKDFYLKLKENLISIDRNDKGQYLTPIDLMFAAIKKPNKIISLSINNVKYIINYDQKVNSMDTATFKKEFNKEGVTLSVFRGKESDFVYLVPYLMHGKCLPNYVSEWKYNMFSTYELTGGINSHLPGFLVNIPTTDKKYINHKDDNLKFYILDDRTGIRPDKIHKVEEYIRYDVINMIIQFSKKKVFFISSEEMNVFILKYLYNFIIYKCEKSNSSDWNKVLRFLAYNTYVKNENEGFIALKDFKFYEYDSNVNIKEHIGNFIFVSKNVGQKSYYSKYWVQEYDYKVIINKKEVLNPKQYDKVEEDEDYPKLKPVVHIFSLFPVRKSDELTLLSAENDMNSNNFSESTLAKIFKVLKNRNTIKVFFDNENRILNIESTEYKFYEYFKLKNIENVYKKTIVSISEIKNQKEGGKEWQEFLLSLFKNTLLAEVDCDNKLECIKKYKEYTYNYVNHLKMKYSDNNLQFYYNNYIIEQFDIFDLNYEELYKITEIANYNWFKNKKFNDYFEETFNILDKYNYRSDIICKYANIYDDDKKDKITNFFDMFSFAETEYNIGNDDYILTVKDGIIKDINLIDEISKTFNDYDFLYLIIHKIKGGKIGKINRDKLNKFIDIQLQTDNTVSNIYKKIETPLIKTFDQFPIYLKPILDITEKEFNMLCEFYKCISKNIDAMHYAKDVNNKLYGYSAKCSICDYGKNKQAFLNTFLIKDDMKYNFQGKQFNLTLYLCPNDYYKAKNFNVIDVSFGDMNFIEWLQYIKEKGSILAKMLKCKITVSQRNVYQIFNFEDMDDDSTYNNEEFDVTLTPLMAITWYCDNETLIN